MAWAAGQRRTRADCGGEPPPAETYNVEAVPAAFLIDREGKVVAKDVQGGGGAGVRGPLGGATGTGGGGGKGSSQAGQGGGPS